MRPIFFFVWLRKTFVLILLWLMTIAAAVQFGIIYELKGMDSAQKRLMKLEAGQGELAGKVESHTAILRGIGKGRNPQIP